MKTLKLLLPLLLLLAFASHVNGQDTLTIGYKKNECVNQTLCVIFDSLLEDSRCPTGLICIWQGKAEVRLILDISLIPGPISTIAILYLNTDTKKDTTIGLNKISLLSVDPYPEQNQSAPVDSYSVTLLVTPIAGLPNDSFYVLPTFPTSTDSIDYYLLSSTLCCCSQTLSESVVADEINNTVDLFFEYDNSSCSLCDCADVGGWVTFNGGSLKPGTYEVFKSETPYCPPQQICPIPPIARVKVGEITVTNPISVEEGGFQPGKKVLIHPNPFKSTATISIPRALSSKENLRIYNVGGKVLTELSPWHLTDQNLIYQWNARDQAPGVYFFHLQLPGKVKTHKLYLIQ